MQLKGIYLFETYVPVVQWTIISLILIFERLSQSKSKHGDITPEFLHAELEENTKLFFRMPKEFDQYDNHGNQRVLMLRKNIYVICQSPRDFWKYLTTELISSGMI